VKRLVLVALLASTAHANVWDRAIETDQPNHAAQDKYDSEMRQGDEHAILAGVVNASIAEVKRQLQLSIVSYRAAAQAKPSEGEPHFRIGKLLYAFYFDCGDPFSRGLSSRAPITCRANVFDRDKAKEIIAAWDAFEARSPLDPRLSVAYRGDSEILFDRAILQTKLATKQSLAAAALDYEKILSRADSDDTASSRVLGNLAETYMMLRRMDEALETYREALRGASDTSTWYGYAVALDRDGSGGQAHEIIKSLGRDQYEYFKNSVGPGGNTFFVPEGEKYYYFALAEQAFGYDEEAIQNWKEFLKSGAHPDFQPRAKAHLDALMTKKRRKAIPIDPPWPELFR
jgi:tetratricopeptide (TPR) repeat protein